MAGRILPGVGQGIATYVAPTTATPGQRVFNAAITTGRSSFMHLLASGLL
jgi:hypothetical protein